MKSEFDSTLNLTYVRLDFATGADFCVESGRYSGPMSMDDMTKKVEQIADKCENIVAASPDFNIARGLLAESERLVAKFALYNHKYSKNYLNN